MALLLETCWGDLVIDLDLEGSPELCRNFLRLAQARFYTQTLVFQVTAGRFCQCGDPVGDGTGGTCWKGLVGNHNNTNYHTSPQRFLASRLGRSLTASERREMGRVVATCQVGRPDTIGSQFLITIASGPDRGLDNYYNLEHDQESLLFRSLGKVTEDPDQVLDKINAAYCDPQGRPYADIRIRRVLVVYDPFREEPPSAKEEDDSWIRSYWSSIRVQVDEATERVEASPSPERPSEERVAHRIAAQDIAVADDGLNSNDEENEEIIQQKQKRQREETEQLARRQDQSRAVVLEMLGDLPDASIRAPEDTLFVCKLNPITTDEDLELIFSRFDPAVKVQIIRDVATGASLQYAFVEFQGNKSAAAEAYFKMNNALVDDRRIHVDFSQSVAKLWDKYRQRLRIMPRVGMGGGTKTMNSNHRGGPRNNYGGRGAAATTTGWNHRDHAKQRPESQQQQQHQHNNNHNDTYRPGSSSSLPQDQSPVDDFGRSREFQRPDRQPQNTDHHPSQRNDRRRSRDNGRERNYDPPTRERPTGDKEEEDKDERHHRKHDREKRSGSADNGDDDDAHDDSSRKHRYKPKKTKKHSSRHRSRSISEDLERGSRSVGEDRKEKQDNSYKRREDDSQYSRNRRRHADDDVMSNSSDRDYHRHDRKRKHKQHDERDNGDLRYDDRKSSKSKHRDRDDKRRSRHHDRHKKRHRHSRSPS